MALVAHHFRRCVGWNCLTEAQRTGIIVSIVIFSVAFFLLYMHCLGRAAIARRERASVRLPGGRRVSRAQSRSPSVVAQLPMVQQPWPGGSAMIAYQPALFTVHGPHNAVAQPLMAAGPGPYAHPPTAGMNLVPPSQQMHGHRETFASDATRAHDGPHPASRTAPVSPPSDMGSQEQPAWRQMFGRALHLPVGRASTIESVSNPSTPRRVGSPDSRRGDEGVAHEGIVASGESNDRPSTRLRGEDNDCVGEIDSSSLQTNIAVVHSDDFQMVDQPAQQTDKTQLGGSKKWTTTQTDRDVGKVDDEVEMRISELSRIYWIPSESSFQPYEEVQHGGGQLQSQKQPDAALQLSGHAR